MKDINLFEGIRKSAPPKKSGGKSAAGGLLLLIACALAVGGLYFWLTTKNNTVNSQIESANGQISAVQDVNGNEMVSKQGKLTAIRSFNAMLTALKENIQAYPMLDAGFLGDLEGRLPATVTVQAFAYKDGVLTLDCTAGNADAPANFADALIKSAYIDAVNLKGSQLNTQAQQETGAVQYSFTIECYLKGGTAQ